MAIIVKYSPVRSLPCYAVPLSGAPICRTGPGLYICPVAIALKTQTGLIETASPAIPAAMISLAVGLRYSSVGMLEQGSGS